MAIKIRLARAGSKKRPFYRIVASDSRMPRDGRFIEKLGTYNPLLSKDDENRVVIKLENVKKWLEKGAIATDRIQRILENLGELPKKVRNNPKKGLPGKATKEREEKKSNNSSEKKEISSENQIKKTDELSLEKNDEETSNNAVENNEKEKDSKIAEQKNNDEPDVIDKSKES